MMKYDEAMMSMAQDCGSLESLLDAFMSFLHRKTDFYVEGDSELFASGRARMGFPKGQAEKLLIKSFNKFPKKRMPPGGVAPATGDKSKKPANSPSMQQKQQKQQKQQQQQQQQRTSGDGVDGAKAGNILSAQSLPALNEKGEQVPVGNGGVTDRYYWTQSLYETTIYVAVPEGTKGRDVDCQILANSVSVKLKSGDGKELIKGDFPHSVRARESLWSLDSDAAAVVIVLDKVKNTWWESAVKGDQKIDTSRVDSTMKIDEYDPETQGAIRKIMFDQKQKRLNLPTSDELAGAGGVPDDIAQMMANMPSPPNMSDPPPSS